MVNRSPAGEPLTEHVYKVFNVPVPGVERTRVLLVEDDNEMRTLLAQALRDEEYDVLEAFDGEDASRLLALESTGFGQIDAIDLIVTDVRMPRATGLDLLSSVRFFDWVLPVILISAFADQEVHAVAQRLGAAAVLAKPFSLGKFVEVVREIVPPRFAAP